LNVKGNLFGAASNFRLTAPKYRRKTLTPVLLDTLREAFTEILEGLRCTLLAFGGEADHVHLLAEIHPALNISTLINNRKTASARRARNRFAEHLKPFYGKPYFWHRAYLWGQCRRRDAGYRAALRGKSGDKGKAAQGQTVRLTPSWPCGPGRGMRANVQHKASICKDDA
jgi:REP element-mobilizing transposase RayT